MNTQSFSGADLDQLRVLSARLKSQSGKMREVANSSTFALMAAEWSGGEIDAIRDQWRRNSMPTITRLADSLEQLGSDLDQHVAEQERVSGGGGSGGIGGFFEGIRQSIERFMLGLVGPLVPGSTADGVRAGNGDSPSDSPRQDSPIDEVLPPAPTVDVAARNAQVLQDWRAGVPNGTKVDWDGSYGVQCVDLVRHYMNAHFPGQNLGGGVDHAFQMYDAANPSQFDRVPPGATPQPGDIIVIGKNDYSPDSGHVAIVDRVDANGTIHVVQQSGGAQDRGVFTGSPSRVEMDALVGYLRPKHA